MKSIIRVICIAVLLAMILPMAISCQKENEGADTEGQDTVFEITPELLASYSIIVPDNASDEIHSMASAFCDKIKVLMGIELKIRSDFVAEGSDVYCEAEHEILVGLVERSESQEAHANIKTKDSGYSVINKKIILFGHSAEALDASPDVFGTTEVTDAWLTKLKSELSGYECFSGKKCQQSTNGEYNAIFYNKDKFDVVSGGTKWFSSTPDRASMYSGAKHYMIFNYAELCHKESGVRFVFVVAHFEPYRTSSTNPDQIVNPKADDVRMAQAKQLKAFVEEQSLPVVLVGDFNDSPNAKSINELVSGQVISYAMDIAKTQVGKGGTLISSDYKTRGSAIYDYVFVTDKMISVARYEIIDNKVGNAYPSDHLPVAADITVYN